MAQVQGQLQTKWTWHDLRRCKVITLAVDTEFTHEATHTIQVAARTGTHEITVQVYHAPRIRGLPKTWDAQLLAPLARAGAVGATSNPDQIVVRAPRPFHADLSPLGMVRDLFGIKSITPLSRSAGARRLLAEQGGGRTKQRMKPSDIKIPRLQINIVGHFLPADFARLFGARFFQDLFTDQSAQTNEKPLVLRVKPCVGLSASIKGFGCPVVEYAVTKQGALTRIVLETIDTNEVFGPGSLDRLARTFLGLGKLVGPTAEQKANMRDYFHQQPLQASTYAVGDAVLTLKVLEAMNRADRAAYDQLGVAAEFIQPAATTMGKRGNFVLRALAAQQTQTSALLTRPNQLNKLIRRGGRRRFQGPSGLSAFGKQTASTHGGLTLSRSLHQMWHEAFDQFRDVDMKGCYNQVLQGIHVYLGEPIVVEPGRQNMTLRQAVALMAANCPRDGWFLRVTGRITGWDNVLIPSTRDATTHANFRARQQRSESPRSPGCSRLYTATIESGIVTADLWDVIQHYPEAARQQYENLIVETIVCYPQQLIVDTGAEYDALVARLGRHQMPWESSIDFAQWRSVIIKPFEADQVALRFPLHDLAQRVAELRQAARLANQPAQEQCWKLLGNTLYGNLAGVHSLVSNVVAANVITAAGRAAAWCLMMGMNGFQVVTDGCTYRRDQIPRVPLAECLQLQPDYLVRRADPTSTIPFYDADEVPLDDAHFTAWYHEHRHWFFQQPAGTRLDSFHFEHKRYNNQLCFDALVCDGASNDIKLTAGDGARHWKIEKITRRGLPSSGPGRQAVAAWLIAVAQTDEMKSLPPLVFSRRLLGVSAAIRAAGQVLQDGSGRGVRLPLGFERQTVQRPRLISASSFLYADPAQEKRTLRQFEKIPDEISSSGLEILALRRGYGDRHEGSIAFVLGQIIDALRSNEKSLTRKLHLDRPFTTATQAMLEEHQQQWAAQSALLLEEFTTRITFAVDAARLPRLGICCSTMAELPRCQLLTQQPPPADE